MKISKFAITMQITAVCTSVLTVLFAILHAYYTLPVFLSLAITFGTTCYHFSMRLLVGALVSDRFDYHNPWFQPKGFEAALYKKLQLKRWKLKMPTYTPRLFSLQDNSLEQIVCNMCQAEVVHEIIIPFSFIPLLFSTVWGSFAVFFITSVLAACFDLLFVMLQRYNRPRIVKMLKNHSKQT